MRESTERINGTLVRDLHGTEGALRIRRELQAIGQDIGTALMLAFAEREFAESVAAQIDGSTGGWTPDKLLAWTTRAQLAENGAHRQAVFAMEAFGRALRIAIGNNDPSINGAADALSEAEFRALATVMGAK